MLSRSMTKNTNNSVNDEEKEKVRTNSPRSEEILAKIYK